MPLPLCDGKLFLKNISTRENAVFNYLIRLAPRITIKYPTARL
jgi:hypothetical protein